MALLPSTPDILPRLSVCPGPPQTISRGLQPDKETKAPGSRGRSVSCLARRAGCGGIAFRPPAPAAGHVLPEPCCLHPLPRGGMHHGWSLMAGVVLGTCGPGPGALPSRCTSHPHSSSGLPAADRLDHWPPCLCPHPPCPHPHPQCGHSPASPQPMACLSALTGGEVEAKAQAPGRPTWPPCWGSPHSCAVSGCPKRRSPGCSSSFLAAATFLKVTVG